MKRVVRFGLAFVVAALAKQGEMPLWIYRLGHPEARLSDADREALQRWVDERIAALDAEP